MISAWIRAIDVQKGQWNDSIWIFYDVGNDTQFVERHAKGSFEWSQVRFVVEIKNAPLDLWFRLKSTGRLWIDDIDVTPYKGKSQTTAFIKSKKPLPIASPINQGTRCPSCYRWSPQKKRYCPFCGTQKTNDTQDPKKIHASKMLIGFEKASHNVESTRHPFKKFSKKRASQGQRSAKFLYGEYYNFNMNSKTMTDWTGYDYLALDVFNPLKRQAPFTACIRDRDDSSYWNQQNHISTLAPGWNHLRLELNRFVGERGSVKIRRYLNLASLKRFFISVGAEEKQKEKKPFLVDAIRLLKAPPIPKPFQGLRLFDFAKHEHHVQKGFTGILSWHLYNKSIGFGFRDPVFWRIQDAQYASKLHRDAILLNKGQFIVDIPNGKYTLLLVANHLGKWYEHFWTERTIRLQGKTILKQSRNSAESYLSELLRFQDIEPTLSDHPHDLYLKKIFSPLVASTTVKNRQLILEFEGDNSAIGLNSLIIYPSNKEKQATSFLAKLDAIQKNDLDLLSRSLIPKSTKKIDPPHVKNQQRDLIIGLSHPLTLIKPHTLPKSEGENIQLEGGWGQRPAQALWIRNLTDNIKYVQVTSSPLFSKNGQKIRPKHSLIRYAVNQYQCHQFNHETYELAPRFLRTIPAKGIHISPHETRLLWIQIPLKNTMRQGSYRGKITITGKTVRYSFPLSLKIYPFTLPEVDIPIGYFGLNPIPFTYFKGKGVKKSQRMFTKRSLQILKERGFSTWTSLPNARIQKKGNVLSLETTEIDWLMREARQKGFKNPIFTYGAEGFDTILSIDAQDTVLGIPIQRYHRQVATLLRKKIKQFGWLPLIFSFSDEASGYSDKVERDLRRAKRLKQFYPFMRRGGFTHPIPPGKKGHRLNMSMTDISLSSLSNSHIKAMKAKGRKWGLYNAAVGLFEHGRATFGEGIFAGRKHGLSHRLAWHFSLMQNYPYYDLDGRENDAMMVFPKQNGDLDISLKLEWATMGLEDYRLLLLLEQLLKSSKQNTEQAKKWLESHANKTKFLSHPNYPQWLSRQHQPKDYDNFQKKIISLILPLL